MAWIIRQSAAIAIFSILVGPATAAEDAPHWGYQGEVGPAAWAELSSDFSLCGSGKSQSPISIPGNVHTLAGAVSFDYGGTKLSIVINGHTIQINHDAGSSITVNGKIFTLQQFHFHAPSEHEVDGVPAAMEMHLVHAAADGTLAVIGIMFDFTEEDNPWIAKIWDDMPKEGAEKVRNDMINVADAFETAGEMVSYSGSLTTPPCSEGVSWFLMKDRATISNQQVAAFVRLLGFNARPTQPLDNRLSR